MKLSFRFPLFVLLATMAIFFTSCDDDDTEIELEEEVITTLIYTLTPDGGGTPVTLSFTDLDGDGGNPPVIVTQSLAANTTYNGAIVLRNESETPAEDITAEIREFDEEHQFFFIVAGTNLTVSYTDTDADNNPVGLTTQVVTGDADTGTLTINLIHEPEKGAENVSNGDITNAGGESDIEVTFDITVE